MKAFHLWLTGNQMTTPATISPPNCIAVLTNWRMFATILNYIGEGKVTLPGRQDQPKPRVEDQLIAKAIANFRAESQEVLSLEMANDPNVQSYETEDTETTKDTPAQEDPTVVQTQIVQPAEVVQSEQHTEENLMEVDQCIQSESGGLASGLATSEEAVLLGSPSEDVTSVSSFILESPPKKVTVEKKATVENVGTPYDNEGWWQRKRVFFKANSKDRINFIDSHMHLDKLKRISQCRDIDAILDRGPMPETPVYLQAVVANFCHELPTKDILRMWKQDTRIFHSHGIHPKLAHTVTDDQFHQVFANIFSDQRCVGIGEFGLDYSAHYFKFKQQQIQLCERILRIFVEEELYSKTLVIHCRDSAKDTEASTTCLKIFKKEIPGFHKEDTDIHYHCFNGGMSLLRDWLSSFRRVRFGITGVLLRSDRHPELEDVVKHLDLCQILLETDSPYLTPPVHGICTFNTPYGLEEVARRVAELKDTTIKEILTVCSQNAADLYGLK